MKKLFMAGFLIDSAAGLRFRVRSLGADLLSVC